MQPLTPNLDAWCTRPNPHLPTREPAATPLEEDDVNEEENHAEEYDEKDEDGYYD